MSATKEPQPNIRSFNLLSQEEIAKLLLPKVSDMDFSRNEEYSNIKFSSSLPDNHVDISSQLNEIVELIKYTVVTKSDMKTSTDHIIKSQEKEFQKIENLIKENENLRNLLDSKYSGKELFAGTILLSFFLAFSLIGWYLLDLKLIHPLLSIPLLFGSLGFAGLSFWKMK